MTDKPAESAVERYEKARQPIDVVPESAPSNTAGLLTADLGFTIFVEGRLADAAIAELKAEVERLKDVCRTNQLAWIRERAKVEAAETERDELLEMLRIAATPETTIETLREMYARYDATHEEEE